MLLSQIHDRFTIVLSLPIDLFSMEMSLDGVAWVRFLSFVFVVCLVLGIFGSFSLVLVHFPCVSFFNFFRVFLSFH